MDTLTDGDAPPARAPGGWPEPVEQLEAALRAVANAFTFGGADRISAGGNALLGLGGPGDVGRRYRSLLEEQQARDGFDANHRRIAHVAGGLLGAMLMAKGGGRLGGFLSGRLAPATKGALGEGLSWLKTRSTGDYPVGLQVRTPLSRSYTVADQATKRGFLVEAKFGPDADLSRQQRLAVVDLGPMYRVDRWLPRHVGQFTGAGSAAVGAKGVLAGDTDGR